MSRWLGIVLTMLTMGCLFGGCGDLAAIPLIWSWGGDEIVPLTREETIARLNTLGFPDPVDANGRIVLAGADLHGADLRGANLTKADLTQANLTVADLRRANLRGADLNQADLQGASLGGADLRRANLTKADLRGASLMGAHLREANLTGATYNAETWWPNRFDPQAQGAILSAISDQRSAIRPESGI